MKNPTGMEPFADGDTTKTHINKTFEYPASLME